MDRVKKPRTGSRKRESKFIVSVFLITVMAAFISGCSAFKAEISEMKGNIAGNTYTIDTFDNEGNLTIKTKGENIAISSNIVTEQTYDIDYGWDYTKTISSVITITIDGKQMISCGDTCIFYEDGLEPEVVFSDEPMLISSQSEGVADMTIISKAINGYKNAFGKSMIVIIKSQLGDPIYAFSGDEVNWSVSEDLPKTTRLMIDGKLLYIHRGNFQIIDKSLVE